MERDGRPKEKELLPRPDRVSTRSCSEGIVVFKRDGIVPGGMRQREMAITGERGDALEKVTRCDISARVVSRNCTCMFAACVIRDGGG